jgi:hypothetical protein
VGTTGKKKKKMGEKSRNGTEKRWQKCRHHTHVSSFLSVNWLRHRPLLLSFSLSPLLVCLFSHKINNVSPRTWKIKKVFSFKFNSILVGGLFILYRWNDSQDR